MHSWSVYEDLPLELCGFGISKSVSVSVRFRVKTAVSVSVSVFREKVNILLILEASHKKYISDSVP